MTNSITKYPGLAPPGWSSVSLERVLACWSAHARSVCIAARDSHSGGLTGSRGIQCGCDRDTGSNGAGDMYTDVPVSICIGTAYIGVRNIHCEVYIGYVVSVCTRDQGWEVWLTQGQLCSGHCCEVLWCQVDGGLALWRLSYWNGAVNYGVE